MIQIKVISVHTVASFFKIIKAKFGYCMKISDLYSRIQSS